MKHVFILNPVAGKRAANALEQKIKKAFAGRDEEFECYHSEYRHHAAEITREIASRGERVRIYACGGDGTLFDVVNGAVGFDNVSIGVVPCGSGNDYVKTYGGIEPFLDLGAQIEAKEINVDLMKYNDIYGINIVSMGFDAEVCNHKARRKILSRISGTLAYTVSIFTAFIFNFRNKFTVTVEGHAPQSGEFLFVVGACGRFYGGGYQPTPMAIPNDGVMDIMLLHPVPRYKVPFLLPKYRRGEHLQIEGLCETYRANSFLVESDNEITVNLDGETFRDTHAKFTLCPSAIKFAVPRRAVVPCEK
jgi:diacylglycerol kinase (ATP)